MALKQPLSRPQLRAPKERLEYPLTDFAGIDNSNDPASIDANQSPDTLNTVLDSVGSIQERKGYTKLLTTKLSSATQNGKAFYKSDGTSQLIYGTTTTLNRYNNAGGSTSLGTGYTAAQWDFDTYNDVFYAINGTSMLSWSGTALSTVSGAPTSPQYFRIHKNRSWIASGSTLYFSDAGAPTSFPVGNLINVNTNDGQVITGLESLLDALIVFKTDSIWVITGEPLGVGNNTAIGNLVMRRANSDVGCVSYKTIWKVGSEIIFAARTGLFVFSNYKSSLISQSLNQTFKQGMNTAAMNQMWAVYSTVEKKYLLGFAASGSNTPNQAICYDLIQYKFTLWDDLPGAWATNFRFTQQDVTVMGDAAQGNIYQLFQGYADIAGDNGTVTGATSTTLTDSTKAWTTNQFVDCRVQIGLGSGTTITGTVTANTATVLTISGMSAAPSTGLAYTIGGYNSYWKSRVFDLDAPQMSKRFKYLNIFTDSEANYSLQWGVALDFAALDFNQTPLSLSAGSYTWDQAGVTWDQAGVTWDSKSSLFKRGGLPGQGRFIQVMFGNFNANQPWRVFSYSISYKLKKARPN